MSVQKEAIRFISLSKLLERSRTTLDLVARTAFYDIIASKNKSSFDTYTLMTKFSMKSQTIMKIEYEHCIGDMVSHSSFDYDITTNQQITE